MSAREGARAAIVGASGVARLVSVARGDDVEARRDAALILACLAAPPHSEAVAASGGVDER